MSISEARMIRIIVTPVEDIFRLLRAIIGWPRTFKYMMCSGMSSINLETRAGRY
jgi:hypothetical protein